MPLATLKLTIVTDAENPTPGDLHLVNSQPVFVGPGEASPNGTAQLVAQELYVRLNVARGEWFEDAREGVPWFESILFRKLPDLRGVASILRRVVERAPYVAEVLSFDLSLDSATRQLSASWKVRASDGSVVEDVTPVLIEEAVEP